MTVCIPAHNEDATIAKVVGAVIDHPRVARVLVVDDGSSDTTAHRGRTAGAEVVRAAGSRPGCPRGKGHAMTTGLNLVATPLVVFLDADVTDTRASWIDSLTLPLDKHPDVLLVKGHYRRHLPGVPDGGGRVNALLARPLLRQFAPEIAWLAQPLAGECAARTGSLQALTLEPGYGVEIGILLDLTHRHGPHTITEAVLGNRAHRNRPLSQLEGHADDILQAVLRRQGPAYSAQTTTTSGAAPADRSA